MDVSHPAPSPGEKFFPSLPPLQGPELSIPNCFLLEWSHCYQQVTELLSSRSNGKIPPGLAAQGKRPRGPNVELSSALKMGGGLQVHPSQTRHLIFQVDSCPRALIPAVSPLLPLPASSQECPLLLIECLTNLFPLRSLSRSSSFRKSFLINPCPCRLSPSPDYLHSFISSQWLITSYVWAGWTKAFSEWVGL